MESRYAIVTGGSRGIGRAVCLRLAAMGYNILLTYHTNDALAASVTEEVSALGVSCEALRFDVRDAAESESVLGGWLNAHPEARMEVLVNNAGFRRDNLFLWQTEEDWRSVLEVSLWGFLHVTQLVLKRMVVQRYGRIVNVASLSGVKGLVGQTNYSAAKGGVIAATKALSQEVARRGITVNAVAPGFIATDMTADLDEAQLKALIPMQRFGTADEVASVVGFLASREASYVTGEVISINGGLYT